jgi:uncharacterized protein
VGAGLSQAELGARAGVTQSVISAYESGHRQPALPTLAALIDAAGYELAIDVRPQPRRLSKLSGPIGQRVRRRRQALTAAAAAHGVTNLRVFGSVAAASGLTLGSTLMHVERSDHDRLAARLLAP